MLLKGMIGSRDQESFHLRLTRAVVLGFLLLGQHVQSAVLGGSRNLGRGGLEGLYVECCAAPRRSTQACIGLGAAAMPGTKCLSYLFEALGFEVYGSVRV